MGARGEHERPRAANPEPVAPCVRCGTLLGYCRPHHKRPKRISVVRFGLTGTACESCYATMCQRERSQRERSQQQNRLDVPVPRAPVEPEFHPKELRKRVQRVRVTKRLKVRMGLEPFLTMAELRQVLPS